MIELNSLVTSDMIAVFLTEVIDSLARGFEDKLQCDNLILEINSSRYAYNVTVREVNIVNIVELCMNLVKLYLYSLCVSSRSITMS